MSSRRCVTFIVITQVCYLIIVIIITQVYYVCYLIIVVYSMAVVRVGMVWYGKVLLCVDVTDSAQGRPVRGISVAANWGNFYPTSAR